jgi:hypothetical protein
LTAQVPVSEWAILIKPLMGAACIEIIDILDQDLAQMALVEDDHAV